MCVIILGPIVRVRQFEWYKGLGHLWIRQVLKGAGGGGNAWNIGGVPTTLDPNTSEKASRYKWEAYRDTHWWCLYYFLPRGGGILLQKYRDRNGRCIAILFKSIGVRGWLDSPENRHDLANRRSYSRTERFLGPKYVILGRFALRFQWKSLVYFCAVNGLFPRLVLWSIFLRFSAPK